MKFAERLVDGQGRKLDEATLARFDAGAGEVFLETRGLHVERPERVAIERVPADGWPDTFGFVAQPGGGQVS
jgi:hypothetical protein